MEECVNLPRKRRVLWNYKAENTFLRLWGQNYGGKSERIRVEVLDKMAQKMRKMGFDFTEPELRIKVRNMKSRYYREKRKMIVDGTHSNWEHFGAVHNIMSNNKIFDSDDDTVDDVNTPICSETHLNGKNSYLNQNNLIEDAANDSEHSEYQRKQRIKWCLETEIALLDIWKQQRTAREVVDKRSLYEMTAQMQKRGYNFSTTEVGVKIQNMKKRFRHETRLTDAGGLPSLWCHYKRVQNILSCNDDFKEERDFDDSSDSFEELEQELEQEMQNNCLKSPERKKIKIENENENEKVEEIIVDSLLEESENEEQFENVLAEQIDDESENEVVEEYEISSDEETVDSNYDVKYDMSSNDHNHTHMHVEGDCDLLFEIRKSNEFAKRQLRELRRSNELRKRELEILKETARDAREFHAKLFASLNKE